MIKCLAKTLYSRGLYSLGAVPAAAHAPAHLTQQKLTHPPPCSTAEPPAPRPPRPPPRSPPPPPPPESPTPPEEPPMSPGFPSAPQPPPRRPSCSTPLQVLRQYHCKCCGNTTASAAAIPLQVLRQTLHMRHVLSTAPLCSASLCTAAAWGKCWRTGCLVPRTQTLLQPAAEQAAAVDHHPACSSVHCPPSAMHP